MHEKKLIEAWERHPIYKCESRLIYTMLYDAKGRMIQCTKVEREYRG